MRVWPVHIALCCVTCCSYRDSIIVFRCLVIAAFMAVRRRQGSDRTPPCGASLREYGGTDGRILQ